MFISSGTTAVATTDDTAVTLVANASGKTWRKLTIYNEGTVAGFFSPDGGITYARLPATAASTTPVPLVVEFDAPKNTAVLVKRVASGSNLATVWGFVE